MTTISCWAPPTPDASAPPNARAPGLRTICVDSGRCAPAARRPMFCVNISTHRMTSLAAVLATDRGIDGVVVTGQMTSTSRASTHWPEHSGCPTGCRHASVRASVDKGYFRGVCDDLGLPGPGSPGPQDASPPASGRTPANRDGQADRLQRQPGMQRGSTPRQACGRDRARPRVLHGRRHRRGVSQPATTTPPRPSSSTDGSAVRGRDRVRLTQPPYFVTGRDRTPASC